MPCLRHSSAVPRPASDSFRIPTICSSVNRLFRETSYSLLALLRRAEYLCRRTLIYAGSISGEQVKRAVQRNQWEGPKRRGNREINDIEQSSVKTLQAISSQIVLF